MNEEDLQTNLTFDIIINLNSGKKYQATISIEIPTDEIIEKTGYNSSADIENTADSVFVSHGTTFVVPWDKADEYMHLL